MILEDDTLFYRSDHPNGFLFSAGNEAPEGDGWVADPEDIEPCPPRAHECTTLDAYEALLQSERKAGASAAALIVRQANDLASAHLAVSILRQQVAELEAQLAPPET